VLPYCHYNNAKHMTISERYQKTIEYFQKNNPDADTELGFRNPFELIVAVILSAQCTDKRVNMIMPALMSKYPDAETMAKAKPEDIFKFIKSCSYPNNKAKHLSGMSKLLYEEFHGVVPSDPDLLQRLPGVGRKTANVVASVLYKKPVMAVDTHVFRVANRIGLTVAKTPLSCELQLTKHIPEYLIHKAHHWLILHGRYVCKSRNPLCDQCGLSYFCRYKVKGSNLKGNKKISKNS
jgi:endonuclease III